MSHYVETSGLSVARPLWEFVEKEALPGLGLDRDAFWRGFAALIAELTPRNRELLAKRDQLQSQLDEYHRRRPGPLDPSDYESFLNEIGYLVPDPGSVTITTSGVDREISELAGPQLIVPLLNRRFATNAANARWGSLYDALYGTDAVDREGELAPGAAYNPIRGQAVIARGRDLLDQVAPLVGGSHADATAYRVRDGRVVVTTASGSHDLVDPASFVGYRGEASAPSAVLFVHHGLHVEIVIDRASAIGSRDAAGVTDIILEAAVTTIMDLEDAVAAVTADDKVLGYRNWLELQRGTLTEIVEKDGRTFERRLNSDRRYTAPDGSETTLPGRSLLFVRNVGHLMTTDAILDAEGAPVFEGLLDAVMTALGSRHDGRGPEGFRNSRTGAVYVVKPKMHGPDEVAFAVELFARVEALVGLAPLTIKLGIMDEERRTTVNLAACLAAASDRVAFINTGFLDRTGDEIHTSFEAGPVVRKAEMKQQRWLSAYEDSNVDIGLAAGLSGRAQIGKGMWAMPDLMAEMLAQKIVHPQAGATTAWVPSPTAATLHSLHYHEVDVFALHPSLAQRPRRELRDLLTPPLADRHYTSEE
ncbi:MAG TPA: malate synthase G, partial [Pseudolysinimonas sp.]|nr:malate synthase G [Pseudolysinimonas sp.]